MQVERERGIRNAFHSVRQGALWEEPKGEGGIITEHVPLLKQRALTEPSQTVQPARPHGISGLRSELKPCSRNGVDSFINAPTKPEYPVSTLLRS